MEVAEFTVVDMEAADSRAVDITVGTTEAGITADITAAGTMVDTAADTMAVVTTAGFTALGGGHFGGLSTPHRYTTVPMPRTTGIHTMCIHQRPSTHTSPHQHLQPSVTLQWLTKMEG
jgi:hypothetical protein